MKGKLLHRPGLIRRFFSALGPGVIAGAADDDPSGIVTYPITGAQLGTSLLWTAFITCQPSSWPSRITVGITTLVMFGAAAAMFML
jgi:hypothetical protein